MSRFRLWRNRQNGEGCMKLTLLGVIATLGVAAAVFLMFLLATTPGVDEVVEEN